MLKRIRMENISQSSPLQHPNKSILPSLYVKKQDNEISQKKKMLEIPTQLKARFPYHLIYKIFGFPNRRNFSHLWCICRF